ncbi:hypothetical protein CSA56_00695 [candidate division KSB3 bacterium]|uniref:histidine kinase n=1 Tax=candidate division KSB3 bacterium TaxID=2044937 RepID=A0A2G6KKQ2_9BACT|nr:MAG: hypothetical protein CSA56_00695 [candidate division KSB3 bacterium]
MKKNHSLLVIDDSPYILRSVERLFTSEGYHVTCASKGKAGLRLARREKPDVILLDVILPDLDGIELCQQIKGDTGLSSTYVILFSGEKIDSESQAKGLESGADGFVSKTASHRELLARVQAIVRIKEAESKLSETVQELQKKQQELLKTQRELEHSQKKYEELYDFAPVGYCTFDATGSIQEANKTLAEQLGIHEKQLLNSRFLDYLISDDYRIFHDHLKAVFDHQTRRSCEIRLRQNDGTVVYVLLKSRFVELPEGGDGECRTVITDISDRKHAENALQASKEEYQTLVDNLQQRVFYKDRNSTYVTCNESYARDLHISPQHIVGRTDYDFFPQELAEKYRNDDEKVIHEGNSLNVEEAYVLHGQQRFIQTVKTPLHNANGEIIGLLGIFWDITERKHIEDALAQERYLLRALLDSSPDHIYFKDRESRFIRLNKSCASWVGHVIPEKMIGKTDFDFFTEEYATRTFTDEQRIMETRQALIGQEENERWPNGRKTWVSTTKMPLYDEHDNVVGTFGISRDITEHKQAEEQQRIATRILKILNQAKPKSGMIQEILSVIKNFTGFEAVGIRVQEGSVFSYYEAKGVQNTFTATERCLCMKNIADPLTVSSGKIPYYECMCKNILEGCIDPALPHFTSRGSFWTNNTGTLRKSQPLVSHHSPIYNRCNTAQDESVAIIPLRSANRIVGLLHFHDHRKGVFRSEMIDFLEGLGESIGTALDHKQAEEEMARLRNLLNNIIDSMPSAIIGVNRDGRVTHWNLRIQEITHISAEEATGQLLNEVFPRIMPYMGKIHRAIERRTPQTEAKVTDLTNDSALLFDIIIYPLISSSGIEGVVIRIDDVTERVRMEEMVIQSEKMLSLGGLAAGMAHELNNPLASMLQNAHVILNRLTHPISANALAAAECNTTMDAIRRYAEQREITEMLDIIKTAGERAAQIVADMLTFSRKSSSSAQPHDIRKLLDKTVDLASHIYGFNKKYNFLRFTIIREYEEGLPNVLCENTQIQQVFLNVLTNAVQAMANQQSPTIILRAGQDGDCVRVEIEDNGPGISENIRHRIFEPFFTTKEVGLGTGLGLSVSYFIITEHHGGTMSVESEPGRGSKFIIHFPSNTQRCPLQ